jgi:hypothetical protein
MHHLAKEEYFPVSFAASKLRDKKLVHSLS